MPVLTASVIPRVGSEGRAVLFVGALGVAAWVSGVSLCPFATLTGLPCPGCGILRAALALLHGHLGESLQIHPLALVALPLSVFAVLRLRGDTPPGRSAGALLTGSLGVLVVTMVVVWAARFGGALGGPVSVHSIWSATGTQNPFSREHFR